MARSPFTWALPATLVLTGLMTLPTITSGQTPPGRVSNAALASALATDLLRTAQLPGLSVAALDGGQVVYAEGVGFRDVARGLPIDSSTIFGSASVAKVVTATAALRLMQAGRFDIDTPLSRWLPGFPGPSVTPRLLAAHLGGIPHYGLGSMPSNARHVWARDALNEFEKAPRVAAPGERSVYSTHGITLLAAMMEQAEQRPILDILRREVFDPFDMRSSGGLFVDSLPPQMTTMYARAGNTLRPLDGPLNLSYSWSGAGLRHTPSDLVRMARAYFDGTLSPVTLQTAFTEQRTRDGTPTGLGFVWRLEEDWRGRRLAHHAGVTRGTRSVLLLRRDERRAVSVMTNLEWTSSIERTANVFAEALFDSAPLRTPLRVEGAWSGTLQDDAVRGTWTIVGDTGWVSVPPVLSERFARSGGRTAERLPIRAIRDELYALVTPWGLFPMQITRGAAGAIVARVQVTSQWWTMTATGSTPAP
jgi:serine beta-lactamase-like protein LACTB, mitochondrial